MARRIKVKLQDTVPARVVFIDPDASDGATLGTNLFMADGSIGTPASVRAWLGVSAAQDPRERAPASSSNHHRLLQGLTLGDDHPQYTQWVQDETITGAWTFQNLVTIENPNGETFPFDPSQTQYQSLFIENPDYAHAGIEFLTISGSNPLNDGIGNQIALWEVGTGGAFTDRSYGFRIRHTGDINLEGNLDWYRHQNSTTGTLFLRFTRESSQIQFASGSSSEPIITFIGDNNTGIYSRVGDELNFSAGGAEKMHITTTGVFPDVQLRAISGSAASPGLSFASDPDNGMYLPAGNQLGFSVGGTLRLHLTTALLTSTLPCIAPSLTLGTAETMTINGAVITNQLSMNSDTAAIQEIHTHHASNNSVLYFARSRGTLAAQTVVQNGDYLGAIYAVGYDGTDYAIGAGIQFIVSGTPGSNDMPTTMIFSTTADGATSPTERLRIDAAGAWGLSGANYGVSGQILQSQGAGLPPVWATASGTGDVIEIISGEGINVDSYDIAFPVVNIDIPALVYEASVANSDYFVFYDVTAGYHRKALMSDLPGGAGVSVQVDVFTSNGTWTKPSGFTGADVIAVGQGGGGASGRLGAASSGRVGGGGGGGGGRSRGWVTDAMCAATEAVSVNGAGTGGAGVTAVAANGNNGVAGANSSFGSLVSATGGGGGTGGTNSGNAAAGAGGRGTQGRGATGGTGYASSATSPGAITGDGAGGGGGGAGVTAANAQGSGAQGSASLGYDGGAGGGAGGSNGSPGGSTTDSSSMGGGGGGGGGNSTAGGDAGDGGAGGTYGGGGGGGAGGTISGAAGSSGTGGDGGPGIVIVISYMG